LLVLPGIEFEPPLYKEWTALLAVLIDHFATATEGRAVDGHGRIAIPVNGLGNDAGTAVLARKVAEIVHRLGRGIDGTSHL
jgi:hypothetical protein